MPAKAISIEDAKHNKLFYVVANVVIYRESDGRCLLLKRHEREKAHPGMYATPGGKLEWANLDLNNPTRMNGDIYDFEGAIEDLLMRETQEEAGILIDKKPYTTSKVLRLSVLMASLLCSSSMLQNIFLVMLR